MEKIYLFDMGRVLKRKFDYESFYKELNPSIDYSKFGDIYMEYCAAPQRGGVSDDVFFQTLIEKAGLDISLEDIKNVYRKHVNTIYESTSNIIDKLKEIGKKVYLLSDLKEIDFKCLSKMYDVSKFEKTYLSYETGYMKDDVNAFKTVINDLNIEPENILFFDDNERNINNAKAVGINAYLVTGETIEDVFNNNDLYNVK